MTGTVRTGRRDSGSCHLGDLVHPFLSHCVMRVEGAVGVEVWRRYCIDAWAIPSTNGWIL